MLEKWEFSVEIYKGAFQYMEENPGSEPADAAHWFLANNAVWESWVTPDAAAAVKEALAAGS